MAKRAIHASDTQTVKHIRQSAIHAHNGADVFFPRKNFTAASEGASDAGKGVLLNASGLIDASMMSGLAAHASTHEVGGSDLVDHDNLTNFVANKHIDYTGWLDQSVKIAATPTFGGVYFGSYYLNSLVAHNKVPDSDKVDGYHFASLVNVTNNSSLNTDTRNTRGVTRLYRKDSSTDYSVQTAWVGGYWELKGYNGDTYHGECYVGNAGLLAGYAQNAAASVNTIVRRDVNGYVWANWFNTESAATSSTIARVYCSQDQYIRFMTPSNFFIQMRNANYCHKTVWITPVAKSLTSDGAWHDLDLTANTSANAKGVIIWAQVSRGGGGAERYILTRINGGTNNWGDGGVYSNTTGSGTLKNAAQWHQGCDTGQIIEYFVQTDSGVGWFYIVGYWE